MNGFDWSAVAGFVGILLLAGGWFGVTFHVDDRTHEGKQPLATECYVNERMPILFKQETKKEYDGYFYEGKEKRDCNIIDERGAEVKIKFEFFTPCGVSNCAEHKELKEEWIAKKDLYKYPTKEELAEMYHRRRK